MTGPYGFFKDIKIRCNYCMDVIKPKNDIDWISCSCGQTSIKGVNFLTSKGDNFTDISQYNYENIPETKIIPTKDD